VDVDTAQVSGHRIRVTVPGVWTTCGGQAQREGSRVRRLSGDRNGCARVAIVPAARAGASWRHRGRGAKRPTPRPRAFAQRQSAGLVPAVRQRQKPPGPFPVTARGLCRGACVWTTDVAARRRRTTLGPSMPLVLPHSS
jgi:hypothetical protein